MSDNLAEVSHKVSEKNVVFCLQKQKIFVGFC